MARSGARRGSSTPVRKAPRPRERERSAPSRTEYSAIEGDMFFPKLRRQAKWVFVFLALSFAVGFVVFGVGAGSGGVGIGDLLRGGGGGSSGPSVSDAQKKISKGDLVAYKELADAYRQDGNLASAISAGEQYLKFRPKDYEYMRTVAGDYEGQASRDRDQAAAIQDEVTSTTGGATFSPPGNSLLGRALQPGKIDSELTTAANQKLTQLYTNLQTSYAQATALYQRLAVNTPNDVLLQLLLANAAYQSRNNAVALQAYRRIIKLSPGSAEAQQARQQIQFLKAQSSSG